MNVIVEVDGEGYLTYVENKPNCLAWDVTEEKARKELEGVIEAFKEIENE